MHLADILPQILTRHAIRRRSATRHLIAVTLRSIGAFLFFLAGLPLLIGRVLMRLAGRANGLAYRVERDQ
ncbi:MAG: hypothetical protein F8N39_11555 [Clostridiaceae bacterium]|nr:hypothetical protein [Clostridiaceae bacterium]